MRIKTQERGIREIKEVAKKKRLYFVGSNCVDKFVSCFLIRIINFILFDVIVDYCL